MPENRTRQRPWQFSGRTLLMYGGLPVGYIFKDYNDLGELIVVTLNAAEVERLNTPKQVDDA